MNFYAGQKPGADLLYALSYATTYTPTLTVDSGTDPDLGADGTATGAYHRNGLLITGWAQFVFSGTGLSAGSGTYQVSLPFDADTSIIVAGPGASNGFTIGAAAYNDSSTAGNRTVGTVGLRDTAAARLYIVGGTAVSDSTPFTWAEGDGIAITFAYLADPADLPFGT